MERTTTREPMPLSAKVDRASDDARDIDPVTDLVDLFRRDGCHSPNRLRLSAARYRHEERRAWEPQLADSQRGIFVNATVS